MWIKANYYKPYSKSLRVLESRGYDQTTDRTSTAWTAIRELSVDVKDPSQVEFPKPPSDEYEVARKEVAAPPCATYIIKGAFEKLPLLAWLG